MKVVSIAMLQCSIGVSLEVEEPRLLRKLDPLSEESLLGTTSETEVGRIVSSRSLSTLCVVSVSVSV